MTISTTRSRIRTIGSATLAAAVGLGMGALAVATAAPASAAAIDKQMDYSCDLYINDPTMSGSPTLPDQIIGVQTQTTIPDTVSKGEVIPATPVTISLHMPELLRSVSATYWTQVRGQSDDATVQFVIGGTAEPQNILIQGLVADWMDIPASNWVIPVNGTVPAVTVPTNATGITVNGPQHFTILAEGKRKDGSANDSQLLDCTAVDASQLWLGDIPVDGVFLAPSTLAATSTPSAVNEDAKVTVAVTPADAGGKVSLTASGKEIGSATVANGAATIVVPASALPTAGSFPAIASFVPTTAHKPSSANVTLVRTAALVPPPVDEEPADAKINAKPKPKAFKVNRAAKLKIAIKSASTSLAGTVKVKVGSKTLGKGKTDDAGKATIKLKKIKKKYVKKGKIKLKVTYGGNATTEKAKTTVKVKVKG